MDQVIACHLEYGQYHRLRWGYSASKQRELEVFTLDWNVTKSMGEKLRTSECRAVDEIEKRLNPAPMDIEEVLERFL